MREDELRRKEGKERDGRERVGCIGLLHLFPTSGGSHQEKEAGAKRGAVQRVCPSINIFIIIKIILL